MWTSPVRMAASDLPLILPLEPELALDSSRLQPVVRELPADLETPVSIYLKLAGSGPSFLLESVTGGEQLGRYSFIGIHPSRAFILRDGRFETHFLETSQIESVGPRVTYQPLPAGRDPLDLLRAELVRRPAASQPGLPPLSGGLVGYLSYEMTRYFEASLHMAPRQDLPEAIFLLADTVLVFDHAFGRLLLIGNPRPDESEQTAEAAIQTRLEDIERRLSGPIPTHSPAVEKPTSLTIEANQTRQEYHQAVMQAKEHIAAGDIFQVVLSQRIQRQTHAEPFSIYRALRRVNPSPYMYFFDFAGLESTLGTSQVAQEPMRLIGASPELHVRLQNGMATVRPIAGTRGRGATSLEEARLEAELLADPKERAEHIMLVDLARNDLGRLCEYGSIHVRDQMIVERYSHVIHLVSHIEGLLRPGIDAFDLLRATFPAGTVSGAPKIRAMQIISELEPESRGPYAGAVGYFSNDGSMDTCIAIRTLVMQGQTVHLQAGAGIVADSNPENEYLETLNKLGALSAAIDAAEGSARKAGQA